MVSEVALGAMVCTLYCNVCGCFRCNVVCVSSTVVSVVALGAMECILYCVSEVALGAMAHSPSSVVSVVALGAMVCTLYCSG